MLLFSKKPSINKTLPFVLSVSYDDNKDWVIFSFPIAYESGKYVYEIEVDKIPNIKMLKISLLKNVFNLNINNGIEPQQPKTIEYVTKKIGEKNFIIVEYEKTNLFDDFNLYLEYYNINKTEDSLTILNLEKKKQ